MECLMHDSEVAVDWFQKTFMEANPSSSNLCYWNNLLVKGSPWPYIDTEY